MAMGTMQVLLDNRDAVSGVCETEEGINMLKFQRWFNASARLMTSMDEALDIIINRMGRVGL
jgi:flagellar hook-associated protein 1 FlgK